MKEFKVILFDGVCNLCNASVNFIIDHDINDKFKFASLQSEAGQRLLNKFGLNAEEFDSVVLTDDEKYFTESTAVLKIVKGFGGIWKILYVFIVIPKPIRDFIYRIIANNRYKWFGKKDSCRVPTPELRGKFL